MGGRDSKRGRMLESCDKNFVLAQLDFVSLYSLGKTLEDMSSTTDSWQEFPSCWVPYPPYMALHSDMYYGSDDKAFPVFV